MRPHEGRATRRGRAAVTLVVAAAAVLLSALPASGAPPWWPWPTTTKASTTTTLATTTTKAPPDTTPVPAPSEPCGPTIKKASGASWVCTFSDEFEGDTLDRSKWIPQQTALSSFGVHECFVDTPENVSVQDGALRLTVRAEPAPFTCEDPNGDYTTQYTSASVSTFQRFSQTYGRFEVRARFPEATVRGLQSAIWLWPDNANKYGPWPMSGEIDIAEWYSQYYDRVIPYIHYVPWGSDPNATNNYCMVDQAWGYHTYVAEWTTQAITILYDGKVCIVDKWNPMLPLMKPQPFDHPFMVALTQALGQTTNTLDPATPLPATTEVDYVRVWK